MKRKVFSLALKDDRVEQCLNDWTFPGSTNHRTRRPHSSTKKISYFTSHIIFHLFSPFNCCLSVAV